MQLVAIWLHLSMLLSTKKYFKHEYQHYFLKGAQFYRGKKKKKLNCLESKLIQLNRWKLHHDCESDKTSLDIKIAIKIKTMHKFQRSTKVTK